MNTSIILRSDSYKYSHAPQFPPDTEYVFSYLSSRGGLFSETVFFGLQLLLDQYLRTPITQADIDYAESRITAHMGPGIFNRAGWQRILDTHAGLLPLRIRAVPEGTVVPTNNVLMTVENTDPELPWLTNFVETLLLKVWYPTTVATLSREIRKVILRYLEETGDPATIDFKLHDFGYRGVSSEESAAYGGLAHLVNFKGSDTLLAVEAALQHYAEPMAAFSVPAAEHSTITSWGPAHEYEAFANMVEQFGNYPFYAVVSDSYDIYHATKELWGKELRAKVLAAPGTLVIRPDSGTPHIVVRQVVESLAETYGVTVNAKGYKVLNKVRVIQGDGITLDEIQRILEVLKVRKFSADNVTFGMGGALLQQCNRDTQRFAIKASSVVRSGRQYDIQKTPVTDSGKRSWAGRVKLIEHDGALQTVPSTAIGTDLLQTVWENGVLTVRHTLADVRARALAP